MLTDKKLTELKFGIKYIGDIKMIFYIDLSGYQHHFYYDSHFLRKNSKLIFSIYNLLIVTRYRYILVKYFKRYA